MDPLDPASRDVLLAVSNGHQRSTAITHFTGHHCVAAPVRFIIALPE